MEMKSKTNKLKEFLYVLVGLQVVLLFVTFLLLSKRPSSGQTGGGGNIFPFFPVWIAIFVPVLTLRKKRKSEKEEKFLYILLLLGIVVFVSMLLFVFNLL